MCVVCSIQGANFHCDEEPGSAEILPADIATQFNSYGKPSYGYDQAGSQITRGFTKWNDGSGGNALGTPGAITYAYALTPDAGYNQLSVAQMGFVERAIDAIEAVTNVTFTRLGTGTSGTQAFSNSAQISIQQEVSSGGGWASWSYYNGVNGDPRTFADATVTLGGTAGYVNDDDYGMSVTLHELAHAIGLSHPGDYNGAGATTYESQAVYFEDSRQYSVMSYWSETKTGADFFEWVWNGTAWVGVGGYATDFLLHDIASLQRLYGADMTTRTGDTVYGFNSNTGLASWTLADQYDSIIAAVWDAGGIDTLDVSGFSVAANIDLREQAFSSFGHLKNNFSIARGVTIENAKGGSGNDIVLGNAAANELWGNGGDDTLTGAAGNDTLWGGASNDKLYGDEGNDYLAGGSGIDWLFGGSGDDIIVYDAADDWAGGNVQGGIGIDTLMFELMRSAVNLASYGFEFSALYLLDTASQIWNEIYETYTLGDELYEVETFFDNGTRSLVVYDVDDAFGWSQWNRNYNSSGQLTGESYVTDIIAPTAVADAAAVTEDSGIAASSNLLGNDTGSAASVSIVKGVAVAASGSTQIAGTYGTLTISANGAYSYALNNANASVNALNTGQSLVDSFAYTAANSAGSSSSTLNVTINGVTDIIAPTAVADVAAVTEDSGISASSNLLGNDTGSAASVSFVKGVAVAATGSTQIAGTYGTLTISANGAYSYALNNANASVNALNTGQSLVDSFAYTAANSAGSSSSTLNVTINGVTDAPAVPDITDTHSAQMSVTMSSTYAASTTGDKLLDEQAATSAITRKGADEWLNLDLGGNFDISALTITNRNVAGSRLDGAVVQLLDATGNVVHSFAPIAGATDGEVFTFELATAISAKFVRVDGVANQYLQIADIDVFGTESAVAAPVNITDLFQAQVSVTMSSTYAASTAGDKLLDEQAATSAITRNSADEWIRLDLGGDFDISALTIANRNVAGSRLDGAVVQLLDATGNVVHSFAPITGATDGELFTFELATAISAKFVRIDGVANQYLQIAEIDVFGTESAVAAPVNITDLFQAQVSVTMSSTYAASTAGDKLLDEQAATAAITRNGANEWIRLDLGGDFDISALTIANRNVAGSRLDGAVVQLLDATGNVVHSFAPITGATDSELFTFELATSINARSLYIDGVANQYLQIAEIDVFGYDPDPVI